MQLQDHYQKTHYKKINRFRKEAVLKLVGKDAQRVLDVGCSNGEMGKYIKAYNNSTVFGVDISAQAIAEARKKLNAAYVYDAEGDAPVPKEILQQPYDAIVISEVLEHLLYPEKLLRRVRELSDRDTDIIITVPNVLFWKNRLKLFFGKFDYTDEGLMDRGHIHFFSWQSLQNILWRSGFELIETRHHIPTRGTKWIGRIFPGLFAYQFVVKAKRKRRVVYTAIFGGRDRPIEPSYRTKDCDFVCFTDSDLQSKIWDMRKVVSVNDDPVRAAKIYKILPHKFLPEYEESIWVDGNMLVRGDADAVFKRSFAHAPMAVFDHRQLKGDARDCVYEEAEAIIAKTKEGKYKDDPVLVRQQIERYRKEGYPEHHDLLSGMVLVRKHLDAHVVSVMEQWWEEIQKGSRRDQLSFNYVAWKQHFTSTYLEGNSRNNTFCKWLPHAKKYESTSQRHHSNA